MGTYEASRVLEGSGHACILSYKGIWPVVLVPSVVFWLHANGMSLSWDPSALVFLLESVCLFPIARDLLYVYPSFHICRPFSFHWNLSAYSSLQGSLYLLSVYLMYVFGELSAYVSLEGSVCLCPSL